MDKKYPKSGKLLVKSINRIPPIRISQMPAVSVIIPVFRAKSTLERALLSVKAQGWPEKDIEIILSVDDEKKDDWAKTYGSNITPCYGRKPATGAGPARNRGILAASGQFLAFLDAEPDIVLFATRGKNSQGEEEYLAKRYPTVWVLLLRAFGVRWLKDRCKEQLDHYEMRDLSTQPVAHDVPLLSGCCLLARTDALRAVRGFDERFFLYFEDYDLAMRMRDLGRVVRFGALQFVHHGGKASKKGWRHILWFTRGGIRFFSRWGWRWV